jgi:tRNA threonylcarbamoyladenosine biosynthesis protein TsaE
MPETVTQHSIQYSLNDLPQVASELLEAGTNFNVWLFFGDLGTGKTTLIKQICTILGVQDRLLSSPTFSIINEYPTASGKVFHFDFYRMKNEREILDLGFEEYFDSENFCFIEWPERLGSLLPDRYFKIRIMDNGTNSRTIQYEKHV